MTTRKLALVAVVCLLAAPVLFAQISTDGIPKGTFDLMFDGYCDGLHINIVNTLVGGTMTGCEDGVLTAGVVGKVSNIPYVNNGWIASVGVYGGSGTAVTCYLDFATNTWAMYGSDGVAPWLINYGTFTLGTPTSRIGKPARSGAVRPVAAPAKPAPPGSFNISFPDFCDTMTIDVDSSGELIGGLWNECGDATVFTSGNNQLEIFVKPGVIGTKGTITAYEPQTYSMFTFNFDFGRMTYAFYVTSDGSVPALQYTGPFQYSPVPSAGKRAMREARR